MGKRIVNKFIIVISDFFKKKYTKMKLTLRLC